MIRIGVAGYGGRINSVIQKCLRAVEPDIRVVGIVDPNEGPVRKRLAECDQKDVVFYKTLDEMVRRGKLDALAIGTRCNLHAPYAIQTARYDLPLYLEKPVAIDMRQATALEKAFTKSRCKVVVSFPLKVSPLCVLARRHIEDGAVGEPVHVTALNYVTYGRDYWEQEYRNFKITQGLFLQKATHDFNYLMYLMDSPIVRVAAMWTRQHVFGGKKKAGLSCGRCKENETCLESPLVRARSLGRPVPRKLDHPCDFSIDCGDLKTGTNEDCSSALIEFASGAHGVYTQVFYVRRDAGYRGANVSGYMGSVSFDWYKSELRRIPHHAPYSAHEKIDSGMSHAGGDLELAHDFIGLIRGKGKGRTPIEDGLLSVYACLAAKESAEKGRFVKVRQVGM